MLYFTCQHCGIKSLTLGFASVYFVVYGLVSQIYGFDSVNLKGLQLELSSHVVRPTSRSTNHIALRFCNSNPDYMVRTVASAFTTCHSTSYFPSLRNTFFGKRCSFFVTTTKISLPYAPYNSQC